LGQGTLDSFGELIEYASGGSIQYVGLEAGDLLGEKLRFVIHKNSGEQTKIVDMRVAGVLAGDSSDRNIYLRAEDVATWNAFAISRPNHVSRDSFSQVIVEANSITQVDALAGQIEMLGFDTITSSLVERVKQTYSLISILLGITGLISLVMAGVGVANTMIAATLEQTNEIGLWKALGASNRTIMGLILGQAVGIGLLGGLGGALTGWLGAWLYNLLGGMTLTVEVYNQPGTQVLFAQTPPWLLLAAPTFAMLVGLVSGLSPAMHAAAMPPIKALKEE
jgi:putative ABC transport system permease protein